MRGSTIALLVVLALGAHDRSSAVGIENITPGELALTPAFCQDVQTMNGWSKARPSPRTDHWIGLMGETFWAMHHYCWAMIGLHRAQAAGVSAMDKKWLIKSAVEDYRFVIVNSTPDFVLLPDVYTRMGEAQLLMGDSGAAYDSFMHAREIKPDYWPPYIRWADVLIKINNKSEAKKLIEEGLRHAPDAKPLLDKYLALGGDPNAIHPIDDHPPSRGRGRDASTADAPASSSRP
jgi:tetratricopeptide (TPR) repeat protein